MKVKSFAPALLASIGILMPATRLSSQEAASLPGTNIGGTGCAVEVICMPPGSPCLEPIYTEGGDFPPTCQPDGWVRAIQKCAWKWCGGLVCQCGPRQLQSYTCKADCS